MTIQNQFICTQDQLTTIKAIAAEYSILNSEVWDFFNTNMDNPGRTYDELVRHVKNKELLNDITEYSKKYISNYYWHKPVDINIEVMKFWREYEDGYSPNVYDDILVIINKIEEDFDWVVSQSILSYSKFYRNKALLAASLNGKDFELRVLGKGHIFFEGELLKVIIANHVQKFVTGITSIESESIWFINFLVAQLT